MFNESKITLHGEKVAKKSLKLEVEYLKQMSMSVFFLKFYIREFKSVDFCRFCAGLTFAKKLKHFSVSKSFIKTKFVKLSTR